MYHSEVAENEKHRSNLESRLTFSLFCSSGTQTQSLTHAQQAFDHLATSSVPKLPLAVAIIALTDGLTKIMEARRQWDICKGLNCSATVLSSENTLFQNGSETCLDKTRSFTYR